MVVKDSFNLTRELSFPITTSILEGSVEAKDFVFEFSNTNGQKINIGYTSAANRYFIDRKNSGKNDFSQDFNNTIYAPRIALGDTIKFTMVMDVSSIEVFFDDGVTVMTSLFFPDTVFTQSKIYSPAGPVNINFLEVKQLSSIWTEN